LIVVPGERLKFISQCDLVTPEFRGHCTRHQGMELDLHPQKIGTHFSRCLLAQTTDNRANGICVGSRVIDSDRTLLVLS
jgi:hypothetical protein